MSGGLRADDRGQIAYLQEVNHGLRRRQAAQLPVPPSNQYWSWPELARSPGSMMENPRRGTFLKRTTLLRSDVPSLQRSHLPYCRAAVYAILVESALISLRRSNPCLYLRSVRAGGNDVVPLQPDTGLIQ